MLVNIITNINGYNHNNLQIKSYESSSHGYYVIYFNDGKKINLPINSTIIEFLEQNKK